MVGEQAGQSLDPATNFWIRLAPDRVNAMNTTLEISHQRISIDDSSTRRIAGNTFGLFMTRAWGVSRLNAVEVREECELCVYLLAISHEERPFLSNW